MSEHSSAARELEALTEATELRRVVADLQGKLRRAQAKTAELVAAVREGARDAAVVLGNPPEVMPPAKDLRRAPTEAALLHLSDWQLGKQTETYSTEVAVKRVGMLGEKLVRLVEVERADHPVTDVHNLLGGDLVEGVSIFPGQSFEVDGALFRQLFAAVGALEQLLRLELSSFETVHCWEQTGNHGRLGRKGDHPREDNADKLVYQLARERLAEYEASGRLVWHEREKWYTIVVIGNYRALLVHGDQIKQFGGNTPAFGIARKVNAWASGVVEPFTDCWMGHFHQPLALPLANGHGRTFVNPSIESGSEYAREFVAATGTPGQRLSFVDPERGRLTAERIVWLDDE